MSYPRTKSKVLVIGGGSAGILTAQALSKALNPDDVSIQLVTERPFYVFYPALLRTVVTPTGSIEKQALLTYDKVFAPGKAGEVIVGRVTGLEDGLAHLGDGRQLAYDYLVLATGTLWTGPLSFPYDMEKTDAWIASWRSKFARANNVVIVGGGSVGLELAGEIRHFHPQTNVTIVHSQGYPLNDRYPEKFRKYAAEKARALGINLVLGDRLTVPQEASTSLVTDKGFRIAADLVVPVVGGRPNTEFLRSFDPTIVTSAGTVRVEPTLNVPLANGKRNVYAVGDIIDWSEEKQLAKLGAHVAVVSANIIASINRSTTRPKEYGGSVEAIGITLGPKGGFGYVGVLWGITMGSFPIWLMKSRTLLVEMARKTVTYS